MRSILHIAPHLGGGVGAVVRDLIHFSSNCGIKNSIALLDFPDSGLGAFQSVSDIRSGLGFSATEKISSLVTRYDLTLIHYWNHPLLTQMINSPDFDLARCVVWAHVSGLFNPNPIPLSVIEPSAKTLCTSKISLEAKSIKEINRRSDSKVGVARSVRRLSFSSGTETSNFATKTVAYLGTVSGAKMHRDSAYIFSQLSKAGIRVLVGGGPRHHKLAKKVMSLGGQIEARGNVTEVEEFFSEAQVFIYPLSPFHYGTGEQVLLEAMARGLPVVAFDNPAEREIVVDGETGHLVDDSETFVERVMELLHTPRIRSEMSAAAKKRIQEDFDHSKHMQLMVDELRSIELGSNVDSEPRVHHSLLEILEMSSFSDHTSDINRNVFGEDLIEVVVGRIESDFSRGLGENWSDESKGTPFQYLRYAPHDEELKKLTSRLSRIRYSWLDD